MHTIRQNDPKAFKTMYPNAKSVITIQEFHMHIEMKSISRARGKSSRKINI